jgi:cellulose synthase/poly-beta-1,6-N-acetylglucosamine synthase-like glycosyltransferase
MHMLAFLCLAFSAIALAAQIGTCGLAFFRCRPGKRTAEPAARPAITVVRPLCGLEPYSRETLQSTFQIDYPDYEVLFCVAEEGDQPLVLAALLIGKCWGITPSSTICERLSRSTLPSVTAMSRLTSWSARERSRHGFKG